MHLFNVMSTFERLLKQRNLIFKPHALKRVGNTKRQYYSIHLANLGLSFEFEPFNYMASATGCSLTGTRIYRYYRTGPTMWHSLEPAPIIIIEHTKSEQLLRRVLSPLDRRRNYISCRSESNNELTEIIVKTLLHNLSNCVIDYDDSTGVINFRLTKTGYYTRTVDYSINSAGAIEFGYWQRKRRMPERRVSWHRVAHFSYDLADPVFDISKFLMETQQWIATQ
jgi:hypothetical protein